MKIITFNSYSTGTHIPIEYKIEEWLSKLNQEIEIIAMTSMSTSTGSEKVIIIYKVC